MYENPIMKMMKKTGVFIFALLVFAIFLPAVFAQSEICAVYFTGVGCPHCAKTDPVVLEQYLKQFPNLIIIEYEIYQSQENAPLIYTYNENYNSGFGIPLLIFNKNKYIIGDLPILTSVNVIQSIADNPCPLTNYSVYFEELDFTKLQGSPKIWKDNRIFIHAGGWGDNEVIRNLLTTSNLSLALSKVDYNIVRPRSIALSGENIYFENAVKIDGWLFQWNGKPYLETKPQVEIVSDNRTVKMEKEELTWTKIISLAAVDAINPCALAVLTLMLVAILTYNPTKKENILLAGLAFTISVFIMYLVYGLIIIKFFQLIQLLTVIRLTLYKILGFGAIMLGLLNIKDFFKYRPGGIATEMPMSMRPLAKQIISGVTSPRGAFIVGLFVTIFLLPCTIGPYVIAGGILSALELIKTMPWLLVYNIIFILPMIVITLIIYAGIAQVEDVSGWREKNIRWLHLIAGIIMFGLGLAMLFGWV